MAAGVAFEDLQEAIAETKAPSLVLSNAATISSLAKECAKRYDALCAILKETTPETATSNGFVRDDVLIKIQDARPRFKAWATNIAALQEGHLKSSLDFRLREAQEIRSRVVKILESLKESLNEAELIVTGVRGNKTWEVGAMSDCSLNSDFGSDSSSEGSDAGSMDEKVLTSELDELLSAIRTANSSLMDISIVIRNTPTRDDYVKAAARYSLDSHWDISHVDAKFGSAKQSSKWLIQRLGKSITRRRQYLTYRKEHHDKLSKDWDEPVKEVVVMEEEEKAPQTLALTKATTYVEAMPAPPKDGSEVGSFETETSYQQTVAGETEEHTLKVPPPPTEAFEGVPFEFGHPFQCPYCWTEQNVKGRNAWKKHVFRDLRPYVCTFKECNLRMFRSRNEWFAHELQAHRREWTCTTCSKLFSNKSNFKTHLLSHSPSLAGSELDALILQSEEPMDRFPASACSFCNEWEEQIMNPNQNEKRAFLNDGKDVAPYGTKTQFRRHLGRHMEQLALFALPRDNADDVADDSDREVRGELLGDDSDASTGTTISEKLALSPSSIGTGEEAELESDGDYRLSEAAYIALKSSYTRSKKDRIFCKLCDDVSDGFRAEHELRRHVDRMHKPTLTKWVCIEPSDGGTHPNPAIPLSQCKACIRQKKYAAFYNAAAHLRRQHFNPRSMGKNPGNNDPPMTELKNYWMKEEIEKMHDWKYPANLYDEVQRVAEEWPQINFDNVYMDTGVVVASMTGPWGSNNASLKIEVKIVFPEEYPISKSPVFTLRLGDASSNLDAAPHVYKKIEMERKMKEIAVSFVSRQIGCLRGIFAYLLGEKYFDDDRVRHQKGKELFRDTVQEAVDDGISIDRPSEPKTYWKCCKCSSIRPQAPLLKQSCSACQHRRCDSCSDIRGAGVVVDHAVGSDWGQLAAGPDLATRVGGFDEEKSSAVGTDHHGAREARDASDEKPRPAIIPNLETTEGESTPDSENERKKSSGKNTDTAEQKWHYRNVNLPRKLDEDGHTYGFFWECCKCNDRVDSVLADVCPNKECGHKRCQRNCLSLRAGYGPTVPEKSIAEHSQVAGVPVPSQEEETEGVRLDNSIGMPSEELTNKGTTTIVIFCLGTNPTENQLLSLFQPFGDIIGVRIPDGQLFAYMKFRHRVDAQRAIKGMNGHQINGRSLIVDFAATNHARESRPLSGDTLPYEEPISPELQLQPGGAFESRQTGDDEKGKSVQDSSKGDKSEEESSVRRAKEDIPSQDNGRVSDLSDDQDISEDDSTDEEFPAVPSKQCTLRVDGLSDAVTDRELRNHFQSCGDVFLVRRISGTDWGFVQFSWPADAELAIKQMNGSLLGGSRIHVEFGQMTSSYWFIPEQKYFPALLAHFGSDWHGIAEWMSSKTHIMVKNYYQRQVDSGKQEWVDIVKNADERRRKGLPTAPLPTPNVIPKRRSSESVVFLAAPALYDSAGGGVEGMPRDPAIIRSSDNTTDVTDPSSQAAKDFANLEGQDISTTEALDPGARAAREHERSVRDLEVDTPPTKNRNPWKGYTAEEIRTAASQGDLEKMNRILEANPGMDDIRAYYNAAAAGQYEILRLLIARGSYSPDPPPLEGVPVDQSTPLLAAIGRDTYEYFQVIQLILAQPGFNPTRRIRGETYYEIAKRRAGPRWQDEEQMLKNAFDAHEKEEGKTSQAARHVLGPIDSGSGVDDYRSQTISRDSNEEDILQSIPLSEIDTHAPHGLENLHCETSEDEREIWLEKQRAEKRRKRRSSGSARKRTISQSIGSGTDEEDFDKVTSKGENEPESSARTLRLKTKDDGASLIEDLLSEIDEEDEGDVIGKALKELRGVTETKETDDEDSVAAYEQSLGLDRFHGRGTQAQAVPKTTSRSLARDSAEAETTIYLTETELKAEEEWRAEIDNTFAAPVSPDLPSVPFGAGLERPNASAWSNFPLVSDREGQGRSRSVDSSALGEVASNPDSEANRRGERIDYDAIAKALKGLRGVTDIGETEKIDSVEAYEKRERELDRQRLREADKESTEILLGAQRVLNPDMPPGDDDTETGDNTQATIRETTVLDAAKEEQESDPLATDKQKPVRFKDAVGRKFSFPFHVVETWARMEDLIKQAFLHVDLIGPHVQDGHYDLVGPEGEIIPPQIWDAVIEPGMAITMHMWPMPENELPPSDAVPSVLSPAEIQHDATGELLANHMQLSSEITPIEMDNVDIPLIFQNHLSMPKGIPPEVKKWGQLKAWISRNPSFAGTRRLDAIKTLQKMHYDLKRSRQRSEAAGIRPTEQGITTPQANQHQTAVHKERSTAETTSGDSIQTPEVWEARLAADRSFLLAALDEEEETAILNYKSMLQGLGQNFTKDRPRRLWRRMAQNKAAAMEPYEALYNSAIESAPSALGRRAWERKLETQRNKTFLQYKAFLVEMRDMQRRDMNEASGEPPDEINQPTDADLKKEEGRIKGAFKRMAEDQETEDTDEAARMSGYEPSEGEIEHQNLEYLERDLPTDDDLAVEGSNFNPVPAAHHSIKGPALDQYVEKRIRELHEYRKVQETQEESESDPERHLAKNIPGMDQEEERQQAIAGSRAQKEEEKQLPEQEIADNTSPATEPRQKPTATEAEDMAAWQARMEGQRRKWTDHFDGEVRKAPPRYAHAQVTAPGFVPDDIAMDNAIDWEKRAEEERAKIQQRFDAVYHAALNAGSASGATTAYRIDLEKRLAKEGQNAIFNLVVAVAGLTRAENVPGARAQATISTAADPKDAAEADTKRAGPQTIAENTAQETKLATREPVEDEDPREKAGPSEPLNAEPPTRQLTDPSTTYLPCNTLSVGNLPLDASEDELKELFGKQRGYKRMVFRTKQSGPMCYVEFDDIASATKALHELYGHALHNSVRGGIRLGFLRNPLGVRSLGEQRTSTDDVSTRSPLGRGAAAAAGAVGIQGANAAASLIQEAETALMSREAKTAHNLMYANSIGEEMSEKMRNLPI